MLQPNQLRVVDSHTGGEPTRLVVAGLPFLSDEDVTQQLDVLRNQHDWIRTSLVTEPRGSDVMVGGVILPAKNPAATCGVIFFNNVGYLNMCGHGTIGLVATLAYLERIQPGDHLIETPVGEVIATLHEAGEVSLQNVLSYRYKKEVAIEVPHLGTLHGDIAWGGNWFFLCSDHGQEIALDNVARLTEVSIAIRDCLEANNITGDNVATGDGMAGVIDHIELLGPPSDPAKADSRSFVLCPGAAYDRSPCGTGTSAKLACLAADGKLEPGTVWRQESVIGSVFQGSYEIVGEKICPTITGQAFVTGEVTVVVDPNDPFRFGINADS